MFHLMKIWEKEKGDLGFPASMSASSSKSPQGSGAQEVTALAEEHLLRAKCLCNQTGFGSGLLTRRDANNHTFYRVLWIFLRQRPEKSNILFDSLIIIRYQSGYKSEAQRNLWQIQQTLDSLISRLLYFTLDSLAWLTLVWDKALTLPSLILLMAKSMVVSGSFATTEQRYF